MSESLLRVRPDDPEYLRLAAAEAAFWRAAHPYGLETIEARQQPGPVDRYTNEQYTGDPRVPWHRTIARYGRFRRGLMLGTSGLGLEAEILATNPDLHLTFVDLSEGPLVRRMAQLGARFPGRVAVRTADLNFLTLDVGTYDLVLSRASIHHVTNLEHLAAEIARGLQPGGWCFLEDWVGEPRFAFAPEKRRAFEVLYDRNLASQPGRRPGLRFLDASDLSPFCGVRSDEILPVFGRFLRQDFVRWAGALTVPLMRARPLDGVTLPPPPPLLRALDAVHRSICRALGRPVPAPRIPGLAALLETLAIGDRMLVPAGLIRPGNAFAGFRSTA
ncbi:MAG: class I SAM-dependent methyltransferase [bacterium]|nr:class I SAM-dependent methyltransferase [bacterium]